MRKEKWKLEQAKLSKAPFKNDLKLADIFKVESAMKSLDEPAEDSKKPLIAKSESKLSKLTQITQNEFESLNYYYPSNNVNTKSENTKL